MLNLSEVLEAGSVVSDSSHVHHFCQLVRSESIYEHKRSKVREGTSTAMDGHMVHKVGSEEEDGGF